MRFSRKAAAYALASMVLGGGLAWPSGAGAAESAAQRLLADLMAQEAFRALVPANRTITGLEYLDQPRSTGFSYTRLPDAVPRVPRAIGTLTAVNCDREANLIAKGSVTGTRTESASLTTTDAWEVGGSVSFEIGFPLVGKTDWTFSASYSRSTAATTEEARSVAVSEGYDSLVLPGTEQDIQLIVFEERVDGVPYRLDLVLDGRARINHRLENLWVSPGQARGNFFVGGYEPLAGGGQRELPVCRAYHLHSWHPGKVVAGACNITWGGEELRKFDYQLLIGDGVRGDADGRDFFVWDETVYRNGAVPASGGFVADIEPSRACQPGSVDYAECRDFDPNMGQLYVCAANYRGGWHPGKLVIRDCMIGYGGNEIQRNSYKILTAKPDTEASRNFDIALTDYLPPERLQFSIHGTFEGVAASVAQLVQGPSRPASQALCNPAADTGNAVMALDGAMAPMAPAGTVDLSDSVVLVDYAFDGDGVSERQYRIRQLELQSPHLAGTDVVLVQQALNQAGWPVPVDGFFGPGSAVTVSAFQRANGIDEDGVVGGATLFWLGLSNDTNPPGG